MNPQSISIDNYDYPLPEHRIASHPLAQRDACRLLFYDRASDTMAHRIFSELPALLPANAVLVYNNTRVINARLRFFKETGARIEIFCLEPAAPADYAQNFASDGQCTWNCLVGNSKRWKSGILQSTINIDGRDVTLTASRSDDNPSVITFNWTGGCSFSQVIAAAGEIPIPPYLNRSTEASDNVDYQTVYSHIDGSVAAPTAGLHFTPRVLADIDTRGVQRLEVTLHVGAGTFQPVKSDVIGDHPMHSEFIAVPRTTIERLADFIAGGRTIVAVGTTSVRTLESLYHIGCLIHTGQYTGEVPQWYPYEDDRHPSLSPVLALAALLRYLDETRVDTLIAATRIIIAPGYKYRIVKGMVTNFHQPRSTLLLLVSAFLGGDKWREIYDSALASDYRFLSYGDACLLM
ncbi:MAG: S-adenosylmethionine:tRNA ribosyltransferase-isomerase [Odoribacter sp.]|nr:S-adenosylmethionine:tRNA ribosyltransferase-isomerase [Odoribacter sp.]